MTALLDSKSTLRQILFGFCEKKIRFRKNAKLLGFEVLCKVVGLRENEKVVGLRENEKSGWASRKFDLVWAS